MATLNTPGAGFVFCLDFQVGSTHWYWATDYVTDAAVITTGSKTWEGRILSVGRGERTLAYRGRFRRQTLQVRLANTDGDITTIFRDVTDTSVSYLRATVDAYAVAFGPTLSSSEVKQVGTFRVASLDRITATEIEITLEDKLELVFGELMLAPTIGTIVGQLIAGGNLRFDVGPDETHYEKLAPFAFGTEWVPGIRISAAEGDGANGNATGIALSWIFFVAKSGLTVTTPVDVRLGVDRTKQSPNGGVQMPASAGDIALLPASVVTITKTSVTVSGTSWQVLWATVNSQSLGYSLRAWASGVGVARGSSLKDLEVVDKIGRTAYLNATFYACYSSGKDLSEGSAYTKDPYDIIEAVAASYGEGSASRLDTSSFSTARGRQWWPLYCAGMASSPTTAQEVVEQICETHHIDLFWSWSGTVKAVDPGYPTIASIASTHTFTEDDVIEGTWEEYGPFKDERGGLATRVTVQGLKPWQSGYPTTFDLKDSSGTLLETTFGRRITATYDVTWTRLPSAIQVADMLKGFNGKLLRTVRFGLGLKGYELELGDWILVTHQAGLDTGGYSSRLFRVIGLTHDPMVPMVEVTALLGDPWDSRISAKTYLLDNRANWLRYQTGTITVAGGTTSVTGNGTLFITGGVAVGDVLVPSGGTPVSAAPQLRASKITVVGGESGAAALTLAQSLCSGDLTTITYRIERSQATAPSRDAYGRLANTATGKFADGTTAGYRLAYY